MTLFVGTKESFRCVLRAWLPLSDAVLGMAVNHLPDPAACLFVQSVTSGASFVSFNMRLIIACHGEKSAHSAQFQWNPCMCK